MSVARSLTVPMRTDSPQDLSDQDLLCCILSFLLPAKASLEAAAKLILRKRTFAAVVNASASDLTSVRLGLTANTATALAAIGIAASALAHIAAEQSHKVCDMHTPRQLAGTWLKSLREVVGLTQPDLANSVGSQCYTMVDQIESGAGRVTWHAVPAWAEALRIPPTELARGLMRFYEPELYAIVYGDASEPAACWTPEAL